MNSINSRNKRTSLSIFQTSANKSSTFDDPGKLINQNRIQTNKFNLTECMQSPSKQEIQNQKLENQISNLLIQYPQTSRKQVIDLLRTNKGDVVSVQSILNLQNSNTEKADESTRPFFSGNELQSKISEALSRKKQSLLGFKFIATKPQNNALKNEEESKDSSTEICSFLKPENESYGEINPESSPLREKHLSRESWDCFDNLDSEIFLDLVRECDNEEKLNLLVTEIWKMREERRESLQQLEAENFLLKKELSRLQTCALYETERRRNAERMLEEQQIKFYELKNRISFQ